MLIKKLSSLLLIVLSLVTCSLLLTANTKADEIEEITKQIEDLERQKQMSEDATKPLEIEVEKLSSQITYAQNSIRTAEINLKTLEQSIKGREEDFGYYYQLLSNRVEQFYKYLRNPGQVFLFFSSQVNSDLLKQIFYQKAVADKDRLTITQISQQITQLEADKEKLEQNKKTLENLRLRLAEQSTFFQGEIAKAKDYQKVLTTQIDQLTAKQKELLAKKTGNFATSVGDVPAADDPASRPDYNPGFSPAFALFSFGAPHFKGMSQYGAFGRAKQGQSAEEILKAYYGGEIEIKKDYDKGKEIGVSGFGRMSIETYTKRIYEVPNSWGDEGGMEALKAQAVAARSYALAWTREGTGGDICTDEGCQVYKNSDKGGNWEKAVNDTAGWVIFKDGKILSTWYAASSGGYQESYDALNYLHDGSSYGTPAFWDTQNGYEGWTGQAYEKIAGSPWFYKAWYKTRSGITCSRSHPWLREEEFTDIVNSVYLYSKDNSNQTHLSQEDASCFGEAIENTWSKAKVREEMAKYGGAITSISAVDILYSKSGITSEVNLQTNRGPISLSGQDFYKIFNLRAPGAIHLKSGLFNIEKK